jgi:hypothetical protein
MTPHGDIRMPVLFFLGHQVRHKKFKKTEETDDASVVD